MRLETNIAFLLLILGTATHCTGRVDLGSTPPDGGGSSSGSGLDSGAVVKLDDAGVGAELDASIEVGDAVAALDSPAPLDAPVTEMDSGPPILDAPAPPNGCGGVCSGVTEPSAPITSVDDLAGRWSLCAGYVAPLPAGIGGFPQDTAGVEFQGGTAYLLVAGSGGHLVRGAGLQYVWPAALNSPWSESGATVLNLSNTFTNGLIAFVATLIPAADGCAADLHLVCSTSGVAPYQADLLATGP
jgi:hypothetical protein